mgnify:CR=1 FL=1
MKPQTITMYLPVFREKLERLERRGKGRSAEAKRLRETIAKVEAAAPAAELTAAA